jgi:hypothetical protein
MKTQKCSRIGCENEAEYAWQPFGPDSSPIGTFTMLGWHYRGFPTLKLCGDCHDNITLPNTPTSEPVMHFVYKSHGYWWDNAKKSFVEPPL